MKNFNSIGLKSLVCYQMTFYIMKTNNIKKNLLLLLVTNTIAHTFLNFLKYSFVFYIFIKVVETYNISQ